MRGPPPPGRGVRSPRSAGGGGSRVCKTQVLVVADVLLLRDLEQVVRLLCNVTFEARTNVAPHRIAVQISEVTRVRSDP